MQVGKITSSRLQKTVLNRITHHREDVLVNSGLGEDSAVVDFGEEVLAISSDPITGAGQKAGYLAVHVACNDLAATGADPIGIQVVLLLPPSIEDGEISTLMDEIDDTAGSLGVQILGGHTEILSEVSRSLIVVTAIGRASKDQYVPTGGAQPEDEVIITKGVGLEGSFILANDFADYLREQGVSDKSIEEALNYQADLSVLPEGLVAADYGVNSMHDITEGGLYGALSEMSLAADQGFILEKDPRMIPEAVKEITTKLDIDPYGLISSGSMLISLPAADGLIAELSDQNIPAFKVGQIKTEGRLVKENGICYELTWQGGDELWDFIKKVENNA